MDIGGEVVYQLVWHPRRNDSTETALGVNTLSDRLDLLITLTDETTGKMERADNC